MMLQETWNWVWRRMFNYIEWSGIRQSMAATAICGAIWLSLYIFWKFKWRVEPPPILSIVIPLVCAFILYLITWLSPTPTQPNLPQERETDSGNRSDTRGNEGSCNDNNVIGHGNKIKC